LKKQTKETVSITEQAFLTTTNVLVNKTWYIDSRASQHLMFEKNIFFDYKHIPKRSINMGDNFVQEAIGKGSVRLTMKMGDCEVRGVLHEVFHVLGIVKNLFSISKATTQGLKVEF